MKKIDMNNTIDSFLRTVILFICLAAMVLAGHSPARAAVTVTASGPGGVRSQTLPDTGGPFDLNLPLNKNALNTITVTASDAGGRSVSKELQVTQLSLDQLVVSQVTAERLSTEQVKQLVADGVIQLDNPANYNVSRFDIVLTIGQKPVPITVAVPTPVAQEQTGWEVYKLPDADVAGGAPPPPSPTQIIVFDQPIPAAPGQPAPPSVPGVIIIEGNIKSLKEFYTVRLLLMNTSGIFTLKNVISSISFPNGGLTSIAPADGVISFGDILPGDGGLPGQAERQFIIRGDEIGVRQVKVNFGGAVAGPGIANDRPIPFNGSAMTQVEVKGPPTFRVRAIHPDTVEAGVPYEFKVEITNTGDIPALYASLDLSVGADARLVSCDTATPPACTELGGTETRTFGDILPGQSVSALFTIRPEKSGPITSCLGVADQNITLQVLVGTIGCLVGQFPPERGVPDGVPTVAVVPTPNTLGVGIDSPVVAFFSQEMNLATITTGSGGTFNVYDRANTIVPGTIRQEIINGKTVAIWQVLDNITNRLAPNAEYTVTLTRGITSKEGVPIYNAWTSRFSTTGEALDDITPPTLTLAVDPPVNPSYVLPGQLVTVDAYAADQGSGVVRVELRSKDLSEAGSGYQLVDRKVVFTGDRPPFLFTIDSARLVAGHTYQLMATAYDYMMNAQNATINLVIAPSAAAPTITLPAPPSQGIPQGISVSLTPESITGGVNEVRYYLDGATAPFKTVTIPPYQAGTGTLTLALGSHAIRAVAVDALGQTGEATYTFELVVNPNKPRITLVGTVSGATYLVGSSFVVSGTATDPVGIASVTYALDGTTIATGTQPFTISTAGLEPGTHAIIAEAVNSLGVSATLTSSFVVAPLPNGPPPAPPVITSLSPPANGVVTIAGSSIAGARVDITNSTGKFGITVNADGSGRFSGGVAASAGDLIQVVAYDYTTSQQPSPAATATVPAPPALSGLAALPPTMTFSTVNAWQDVTLTARYDDGSTTTVTGQAAWSSSDPAVAAVNAAGRVVALTSGSATITASYGGMSAQVGVTVDIVTLVSLSVAPHQISFSAIGEKSQLAVTAHYSNGTAQAIGSGLSFVSGAIGVASVSMNGLVTAAGNGATQVTVYYPGVTPVTVPVTVETSLDTAPQVWILSPATGTTVQRGDIVSVSVRATDTVGGVTRVMLSVSGPGGLLFTDARQFSTPSPGVTTAFTFTVPDTVAIGALLTVTAGAEDTGNNAAQPAIITLTVADTTAPVVSITAPAPQTPYNYGDTITLTVHATDRVGVARIRYAASGAFSSSGTKDIVPALTSGDASFTIVVPFGAASPDLAIVAYASDAVGNEGASAPVTVIITNADITPPVTNVTAVSNPGTNPATTVTYQVTDGLADLDHVELFFRRNGIGTFIRYTDSDRGYADGKYLPQSGTTGTITFDSAKMGGDGTYEFYSIGVDKAGNREPAPLNTHSPKNYSGLIGYYPFTGNTLDESGNGNNGTLHGASLAPDRYGQANNALRFNGSNDYVTVGSQVPTTLQVQNEVTLAAWIYVTAYPSSGTLGTIVGCQHDSGALGYAIHLDGRTNPDSQTSPAGHIHFQIGDGGWHTTNTNAQVPLNRWVHVTATRKANEAAKIYYNGVQQPSTSVAWTGSISYDGAEFDIGRQSDYGNRYFNGSIDEVQIYNRALSAAEIQELSTIVTPDQTVTFNAGTNWTIIASPAAVGEGDATYDNKNIRVVGTTFTINGHHSFKNVELLSGAVLTHAAATDAATYKLDLDLWTLTIDSTSMIDLTGRGYRGGRGGVDWDPGLTSGNTIGSQHAAGGSHGGLGSVYDGSGIPAPVYDSFTDPTDLGSGGANYGTYGSGAGGGVLLLHAINVVNDNTIRANGAQSNGSAAGNGGGGSINITASSLSGSGVIEAKGGGDGVGIGGGGGRIAINYLDIFTLNHAGLSVEGGQGQYGARAANGTIFLKQQNQTGGELVVDGQAGSNAWTTLAIPAGYTFDNVTLRNNARVVTDSPVQVTGRLLLTGNSVLTHSQGNEAGLAITAATVQVDAGSSIDATGRGYRGGLQNVTWDPGLTLGGISGSQGQTGGSYGGKGAGYQSSDSGLVYGDPRNPIYLGSGGGNYGGNGSGAGGGRITIQAGTALVVDGAIRADGGVSSGSASGDGSGGSVLIRTSRLAGNGTMSANGGGSGVGVAGGGGRVALYCDYLDSSSPLGNLHNVSAFSGHGQYDNIQASAGTVYVKFNQGEETLFIDDNVSGATAARNTPLTPIGSGMSAAVTADSLKGDGQIPYLPGGLTGLRLNPDFSQGETFVISGNTADTMSVVTPNEHGINFASLAAPGKRYGGSYRYDNLAFRRGGNLLLGDRLQVTGALTLAEYGLLSHYAATDSFTSGLELTLGTLSIDSTSRIDVSGRGYRGGYHNVDGDAGKTAGNTVGSQSGSGGSHGGLGSVYNSSGVPAPLYDSLTYPTDLGAGGANWGVTGSGAGGGRVLITAGSIALDGAILANGAVSNGSASGCGAGGTINIATGSLTGGGTLQANGGGSTIGTGGGGGRIAIVHGGSFTLDLAQITTFGGQGQYGRRGGIGTIFLRDVTQSHGDLVIDGGNFDVDNDTTSIPGNLTFDSIVLRNHARATVDSGLTVAGQLLLTGNSTLTHSQGNEAGMAIEATDVQIDAGSAIDTTGRGYRGGRSGVDGDPGLTLGGINGSQNGTGGSYGGKGGGYQGRDSGLIYGDPRNPVFLGSGGGNWGGTGSGAGGGRIVLHAANSLVVDGAIRSDGALGAGSASGDGSGGSVLLRTSHMAGSGVISANGGGHNSSGIGGTGTSGGGGRVAIYCDTLDQNNNFNNLRNVTAFAGRDYYDDAPASAGTVYFKYNQGAEELFIDDNVTNGTAPGATLLPHIGSGATAAVSSDSLTVDGNVPLLPNGLAGLRLNPDTAQVETFAIKGNTATTISVVTPNENGVNFSSLASSGRTYGGVHTYENLTFRRGGNLILDDPLQITGILSLAENGLMSHFASTDTFTSGLTLTVGTFVIDSTSRIDVTGRGYRGGRPNVPYDPGLTSGNTMGSPGGAGGGRVLISAGHLSLEGAINADGAVSAGSASGHGAGGTVNITAATMVGKGTVSAKGGSSHGHGVGGGGGRIAIRHGGTLELTGISASGGIGYYGSGTDGTVHLEQQ